MFAFIKKKKSIVGKRRLVKIYIGIYIQYILFFFSRPIEHFRFRYVFDSTMLFGWSALVRVDMTTFGANFVYRNNRWLFLVSIVRTCVLFYIVYKVSQFKMHLISSI